MVIFEKAVIKDNTITILDDQSFDIIKGKHSIWIPSMEAKITWSYKGEITSLLKEEYKGKVTSWTNKHLQSIMNEYTIMNELVKDKFVPPIGKILYIKHMISSDFGIDKQGVFGYYMRNAHNLPKGYYTFEKFIKNYYDEIKVSDWTTKKTDIRRGIFGGAFGDLQKPDNIVNGYLIDIRRSQFDCIQWEKLSTDAYKELING
jgi:hypothetical protein